MARRKAPKPGVLLAFIVGITVGIGAQRSGSVDELLNLASMQTTIELTTEEKEQGFVVVDRVIDGDTVDVIYQGGVERIRMLCINTPEKGKAWYGEATDSLEELCASGKVRLAFEEPGKPSRGKYGRLLAYLFDEDGRNVNLEQVKRGWSHFYDDFGPGRFPDDFEQAEKSAKKAKLGIWQD